MLKPSLAVWRWLLALAMLAVLVMSLAPASVDLPSTGWDKTNHLLGFGVLGLLGHRAFPRRVVMVLVGLLAYGGLIEVLQSFTPDRYAEWGDVVADGMGLLLGTLVGWLLFDWRRVTP